MILTHAGHPRQRVRILYNMRRLLALVQTPNVTSIYRTANAVPILVKFIKGNDPMTMVNSLKILCDIVNEEEIQLLATAGNCMATMMATIQKAAKSDDRRYSVSVKVDDSAPRGYYEDLESLLYTTGKLANNDANKEASEIGFTGK